MFQILGLDHLVLRVHDMPRMVRFYTEVLHCEVERRVEELGLVQLRAGQSMIDLLPREAPGAGARSGRDAPGKGAGASGQPEGSVDGLPAAGREVQAANDPRDGAVRNLDHFCVRIEPFDEGAVIAHLIQHGIVPGETRTRYGADWYGPSIYITDPEGNVVELKGPPR